MQSPVAEEKIDAQAVRFAIPVLASVVKFDVAMGRHPCFAVAEEENQGVVGAGVVGGEEKNLRTKWHNFTHFSFEHYRFRQT